MSINTSNNISGLAPQVKATNLPFDMVAKNTKLSETDKIKEASRQFEAVLLRQMLAESHKAMAGATDESESSTSGIYNDMINNQLADSISRSGAFGLARSLQTQLTTQLLPKQEATGSTASTQTPN